MNFTEILITSVSSTALVSILGFLVKNTIVEGLKQSIKHDYDKRILELENKYEKELMSLKVNFEKDVAIEKFKFEKAHPKRIEIIEKLNILIKNLTQELAYFIYITDLILKGELTYNPVSFEKSVEINKKMVREFCDFSQPSNLYLPEKMSYILHLIECQFMLSSTFLYKKVEKSDLNFDEKELGELREFYETIMNLMFDFLDLSRKIINENEADKNLILQQSD